MNNITMPPKNLWLPDVVKDFAQIATPVHYREDSILFWDGDPSDRVFFVEEGLVQMYHYTEDGVTVPLLFHQRGELVGVGGILSDTTRKVYAKTLRSSLLWEMSRSVFFQILHDYPDVTIWVASALSDRLRITDQAVLRAVALESDQRLATTLLDLAQGGSAERKEDGTVRIKITHQELANIIGACRQTTTTALGKFKQQGILQTRKGALELLDLKKLEEIAKQDKKTH
ncbi:MAG: Crp/Fnr family transcriptional regulator [Oscillospiraceae bacterium]